MARGPIRRNAGREVHDKPLMFWTYADILIRSIGTGSMWCYNRPSDVAKQLSFSIVFSGSVGKAP
jgi:hypothetical protein